MKNISTTQKSYLLEILCVVFATLILYLRTVHYDFVWDDGLLIRGNPYFQQAINWKDVFGAGLWKYSMSGADQNIFYYRPMVTLFYVMEYKLWGFSSGGFHSMNIFLHLLSIILIWCLAFEMKLDRIARVMACLFFAFHPAQVACVAFISCHGDLLVQVFSLLALIFWMKEGKIRWLSMLWIFCAMISKEAGVVLPVVIVLFDVLVCERPLWNWKKCLPMLLWIPYFILRHLSMDNSVALHFSWDRFTQNQGAYRTLAYISRIIFPVPDSQIANPIHIIPIQNLAMGLAFVLLGGLLYWRSNKLQKFLLAWFFLGTVIIADWSNLGVRFSDQLLYIPMAAVSILFGIVAPKDRKGILLMVPLFLLFTWVSSSQIPVWKNDISFWKNELKYDPRNAGVNINYAAQLMENGYRQEGCEWMHHILAKLSDRFENNDHRLVLYNIGNCYLAPVPSTAEKYYNEALRISPRFSIARNNLVISLLMQSKYKDAVAQAKILVDERPEIVGSWLLYATALLRNKNPEQSLEVLEQATKLDPTHLGIQNMIKDLRAQLEPKARS